MRSTLREQQVTDSDFVSPEEHNGFHYRDSYTEVVRDSSGSITTISEWYDSNKTHKIKDIHLHRNEDIITHTVTDLYDYTTGTSLIATVTGTLIRPGNFIASSIDSRDHDMEGI